MLRISVFTFHTGKILSCTERIGEVIRFKFTFHTGQILRPDIAASVTGILRFTFHTGQILSFLYWNAVYEMIRFTFHTGQILREGTSYERNSRNIYIPHWLDSKALSTKDRIKITRFTFHTGQILRYLKPSHFYNKEKFTFHTGQILSRSAALGGDGVADLHSTLVRF